MDTGGSTVQKKVLIVEDEGLVAMALEENLKRIGYIVTGVAGTGEEAITLANTGRPDVILMDIHLRGDMDGIIAAEKIRAAYDIPVIFLTAYTDDDTISRAIQAGTSGYLVKPINIKEIFANIELAVNNRKRNIRQEIGSIPNTEGPTCGNTGCTAIMVRAFAPIGNTGSGMSPIGWVCPRCNNSIIRD